VHNIIRTREVEAGRGALLFLFSLPLLFDCEKIIMQFVVLCFFLWTAYSVDARVPSRLRIGGFFSPVSPTLKLYVDQAEHLAAFIMAVNDINNKTDGIYDHLLPGTTFQLALGVENSMATAAANAVSLGSAFGGKGVIAAVSSLNDRDALIVSQLLNSMNVLTVLSVAFSGLFNDFATYPYVANVRPLVSRQGMVVQNMICLSEARKIVVFAGTDEDDIQMMSQFQDESVCELNILAVISVRAELSDLSYEISQALVTGSRYFVNFLPASQNAWLIEQGFEAGLFHDNTVIYSTLNGAANITLYFSASTDIARVMTGFFYFKYLPDYYMGRTEEATKFARRWREQVSRVGVVVNGTEICDQSIDSSGNTLYQVIVNKTKICTGLDFSLYDGSGSDMHPYTALTYDSTILLAMALDMAVQGGMNYKDPTTVLNLIINNITMNGTTGPLNLFQGYGQYGNNGRGARNAGTQYNVYNFNAEMYNDGADAFMVSVGIFDGDTRVYRPCSPVDQITCFMPVYSSKTAGSYNIPPSDAPAVIINSISPAFSALCFAMAAIIMSLVTVFGFFVAFHRRSKVVKASQPTLLWCILFGGAIAALRIVMGGLHKDDMVCAGEVWFGHLAFVVMIGSLFVKSYRVHCIVNTRKLVRVTFSAMHAFRILVGMVAAMAAYLVLTQAVGHPHMQYQATVIANQQTDIRFCTLEYSQFETVLFVVEGLMLTVSFRVCWEIRKVPDVVNESKQISTGRIISVVCSCLSHAVAMCCYVAMSVIVLISFLIMPIVYFLGLSHYTQELVASFGFGFGAIVTLTLLFVPKIMVQYHWDSARLSAKVAVDSMLSSKKKYHNTHATNGGCDGVAAGNGQQANHIAEAMLIGKSKEEKLLICHEQMRCWQVLLLVQQRAALNSNSTSSNARGSSEGVSTSSPVRIEPSILSSVAEMDPDFSGMREELFTINAVGMGQSSCLSVGTYNSGSITGVGRQSYSYRERQGELVIQDV
jgi:hypothetical protein